MEANIIVGVRAIHLLFLLHSLTPFFLFLRGFPFYTESGEWGREEFLLKNITTSSSINFGKLSPPGNTHPCAVWCLENKRFHEIFDLTDIFKVPA